MPMTEQEGVLIREWTIDYGDDRDPEPIIVPHAWRQDLPVLEEGPVRYRTHFTVPFGTYFLVFTAVSYAATILVNGEIVMEHRGMWDAFEVPLDRWNGQDIYLEVIVTKNGGESFPVSDVASGFLPYVYGSFGGIYGEVTLRKGPQQLHPILSPRSSVVGSRIYVDGLPFYVRGVLSWGWYPELGHTNIDAATIRRDVAELKALGFNLVKFCLWVPPHRYLEILREEGVEAWIELPLWNPIEDSAKQTVMAEELRRIVQQYRHHDNVIIWTVGCELSGSTSAEFREYLTQMVRNLTGCPLVKDNSGGAEMYGGDLREYGTFNDFHPYCDTPFYPAVLDSLLPGPRTEMPTLLGEFNDIDVHRDTAQIGNELPYWASSLPELNAQGVRWQYDLPSVVNENRFALHPGREKHRDLMESSRKKSLFMRKTVQEWVRARTEIGGYVITGERDTPISSSGFFDDWGQPRFTSDECLPWNGSAVLFLIPTRRPPWVDGGNRVGFLDSVNFFEGPLFWRVGISSETDMRGGLIWELRRLTGELVDRGALAQVDVDALRSTEIGQITTQCGVGEYILSATFGSATNSWPIWVVEGVTDEPSLDVCEVHLDASTVPAPFWRESAYEFLNDGFWDSVPFREKWSRLLPISTDRVLDPTTFEGAEVLLRRIDTRTYAEAPVLVKKDGRFHTTLRPFGGLGNQPTSLKSNPAGIEFIRSLKRLLSE